MVAQGRGDAFWIGSGRVDFGISAFKNKKGSALQVEIADPEDSTGCWQVRFSEKRLVGLVSQLHVTMLSTPRNSWA